MRRSRLICISTVCKRVPEFTWSPNLPDFTIETNNMKRPYSGLCVGSVFEWHGNHRFLSNSVRAKSCKFGRSAKFGQRHCLFHILIIVIRINQIRKHWKSVEPSHQDSHSLLIYVRIYLVSEVTRLYPHGRLHGHLLIWTLSLILFEGDTKFNKIIKVLKRYYFLIEIVLFNWDINDKLSMSFKLYMVIALRLASGKIVCVHESSQHIRFL